jgi:SAM-dependent methyltransferase
LPSTSKRVSAAGACSTDSPLSTPLPEDVAAQERYFDLARNQYDPAAVLDPPVHTACEIQRVLDRLSEAAIDGPIIDFGAGTGRLSIALARTGYSVTAVDVSRGSLVSLRAIARDLGLSTIATTTALPTTGRHHAVVGADVLHHVDLNDYLPRIRAALCPGGKAIFSEPGAFNPAWYVYLALTHDLRIEKRIVTCNLLYLRHRFERHGFVDVRITGLGLLPRPLFGRTAALCNRHDSLGNLPGLRWFAYRYLVEATA